MADVRALLRQQRAARRIDHPHAAYSDTGRLTCTVCNEPVKTESLWDTHLRSAGHRQRLQSSHQASARSRPNGRAGFVEQGSVRKGDAAPSSKRKLADADEETGEVAEEEAARRKRTRAEGALPEQSEQQPAGDPAARKDDGSRSGKPLTPPLGRRTPGTPTVGVEMQIPSRPATPGAARDSGSSSSGTPMSTTPKAAPIGRSPLMPDETTATAPQQQPIASTISTTQATQPDSADPTTSTSTAAAAAAPVDEDEWAAFEADLIHGTAGKGSTTTTTTTTKPAAAVAALDSDAVISAPAMSAAEVAAKSEEEEQTRRRALVDIQIEDEREEATRALETEFEVMEELEARARRLRERREALRLQSGGGGQGASPAAGSADKGGAPGKENASEQQEEEEDEDDEEEEDDWDGFRFRA